MSRSKLAVPELATVEVRGHTRASFILRGAMATGAVFGAGAVAPFVRQALAQSGGGDIAILNFALTLEYLEADFYAKKAKTVRLSGEAKKLASDFAAQEQAHVQALTQAIHGAGATPVAMPKFVFPVHNQSQFLKLAYVLENTGVGAYNGAGPSLTNKQYLGSAGAIVQVEARHAATIATLIAKSPTPNGAFDKPLTMKQVLAAAGPLIQQ